MSGPYDDIIHLSHPVSATHPPMPIINRAAQFSPFAALTGYEAAIKETARLTDRRMELDESSLTALNEKIHLLSDVMAEHPQITVIYFQPDGKKDGGAYVTAAGVLKKVDDYNKAILMMSGESISMEDILDIECDLFAPYIQHNS